MDSKQFDRVASMLNQQSTRRGAIQFLGAALLAGAGVAPLGGVAAGRGKQRKENNGGRCRKGKDFDRVDITANRTAVETKSLQKGETYRLRVSGVIEDEEWGIDGEYYFLLADPTNLAETYDACFNGTPVGVEVEGAEFSGWGEYIADHVYERKVTGKGKPLTLRLSDCRYTENTGSLRVEVICE